MVQAAIFTTLLVGAMATLTSAAQCSESVTKTALDTIDIASYVNSCAEGSTWELTGLFGAWTLKEKDLKKFCLSTECLNPMHALIDDVLPKDCLITYQGSLQNLWKEVTKLHDKCHELKEHQNETEHESSHDDDDSHNGSGEDDDAESGDATVSGNSTDTTPSSVPTPAPSAAALVSAPLLTVMLIGGAAAASLAL